MVETNTSKENKKELEEKDNLNYNAISKILLIFIILGPIFDIVSFLFRKNFESKISISTFIRPIIPMCIAIYIFFTANKKNKKILLVIAIFYLSYGILHLLIVKNLFRGCSDGNIVNEAQYIANFTFLAIDLIIYLYTFAYEGIYQGKENHKNNCKAEIEDNIKNSDNIEEKRLNTENKSDEDKYIERKNGVSEIIKNISNSITIMVAIYLISIFIAIITKTSSPTYIETNTGYKGWIESGNSLSAILVVSLFIILPSIDLKKIGSSKKNCNEEAKKSNIELESNEKNSEVKFKIKEDKEIDTNIKVKKYNREKNFEIFKIIVAILDFAYLTTTIGTRTGLIGTFLALICYIILEIIFSRNKKAIIAGTLILVVGATGVFAFGSKTLKRRKEVKLSQYTIIDKSTGEVGNITGDMLDIKNSILDGTIDENFMTDAQKQATLDLYNYAKKHKIAGNDTRRQQLIYNFYLVKRQKSLLYILFGNGFKTNFREMVMENELASLLLNFGIIGFILYAVPLFVILVFSAKTIIENINKYKKANKKIENIQESNSNFNEEKNELDNANKIIEENIYIEEKNISNNSKFIEENLKKQIMYFLALLLVLILSWFSGYVLFATSSMVVISALAVLNIVLIENNDKKQKSI